MRFQRSAGILLHPTSLPGKFGIGDLGYEAFEFINFLHSAGQSLWQVLPLGPTGYGDSPYQCFSAFAGNPLLISPEKLVEEGYLHADEINPSFEVDPHGIDFGKVIHYKDSILRTAFEEFCSARRTETDGGFQSFCESQADWLDEYALFMAIKERHGGGHWNNWNADIIHREPHAMERYRTDLADEVAYRKFVQFLFFEQWNAVKKYANSKGIRIMGDLPIFIAYDSADVWANKRLFSVDDNGKLVCVAGVPPDYFSPTGQLWGNPLYKWEELEKDDFLWWRKRISKLLDTVDIMRIDHFRGFDAYWQIPGDAPTAEIGEWIRAPGERFFSTIEKYLGKLPIIAEDLGVITPSVIELREKFNFPGMKILQFAFGTGMERRFLPHNLVQNCVVYTGSHDNDTTRGFFENAKKESNDAWSSVRRYLNYQGDEVCFELVRTAYGTVGDLVVIPMQDVLNLGSEARMNFPGKLGGNWTWRFSWDQVGPALASTFRTMAETYERIPPRA